jgi:hypothetical protein
VSMFAIDWMGAVVDGIVIRSSAGPCFHAIRYGHTRELDRRSGNQTDSHRVRAVRAVRSQGHKRRKTEAQSVRPSFANKSTAKATFDCGGVILGDSACYYSNRIFRR